MCGILIDKGNGNNFFIQKRGQDLTTFYKRSYSTHDLHFIHNLLHITGEKTPQPFVSDDWQIVVMFNGEIYNQPYTKSDGDCIIPLYLKYGLSFLEKIDGEYAIVIFDFPKDEAYFITDPFATKPLWRNGIECASYESGVGGHKIAANTCEIVGISQSNTYEHSFNHHHWDFNHQFQTSYDNCINAFKESIRKRAKTDCFIGLSSGYDSGAIACELLNQKVRFKAYSVVASENIEIIKERAKIIDNPNYPNGYWNSEIIYEFPIEEMHIHLAQNAENFNYAIQYDDRLCTDNYKNDYAAAALSYICKLAKGEGRKVYLSGTGADEILSDYSLIPNQSKFKGTFPDKLEIWPNFNDSCMYSYLGKEECVCGSWNIETRYPYLDKQFVQEFIWLTPELKNRFYKSVLHQYLTDNNFPFEPNRKIGFSI